LKTGSDDFPRRGSVWLVMLEPVVGSETGLTRPAIIISNDINNEYSDTVTVVPVTSKTGRIYPFEVMLPKGFGGLEKVSRVKANQIRTIDKKRLVRFLGELPKDSVSRIEHAIKIHLGL